MYIWQQATEEQYGRRPLDPVDFLPLNRSWAL